MTPFWRDLGERALKTVVGAFASYLFEVWVSNLANLSLLDKGLVFAAGTTACSVAWSLISRRIGNPGTASLTKEVEYR